MLKGEHIDPCKKGEAFASMWEFPDETFKYTKPAMCFNRSSEYPVFWVIPVEIADDKFIELPLIHFNNY